MIFRELIDSITEPFFKGERGNSLFFSIPGQLMGTIATFLPSGMKIIDVSNDLTPIKPFLKILSDCKPEKHVVEENTYKLQTETFLSYFEKGITDYRYDQIRKEEIFFEKQCVQKSIIKLLEIYAKDSYLILNAQHLPDQSIEVIQNLIKSHQNAKFIFCFNGSLIEESSTRIIDFYQQASGYENFFEFRDV